MIKDPLVNQAAQMAHELNHAYCATIGDSRGAVLGPGHPGPRRTG